MHGHGGVLLEHLKYLSLHLDLGSADRFLWQASTSWMMWNLQVSGLLVGSTIVLYDGSPTYPHTDRMWQVVSEPTSRCSVPGPATCWRVPRRT